MTNHEPQPQPYDELFGMKQIELLQTPDSAINVVVSREVAPDNQEHIWSMIGDGFSELNNRSYQRQSMSREEFNHDMDSPNVLKYIAYDTKKEPVGFMTVHTGLEDITWVDHEELVRCQDEVDPGTESFYIGTLVVPQDLRVKEIAPSLLRASLLHWRNVNLNAGRRSLCFFDCAEANYPGLPRLIQRIVRPSKDFEGVEFKIQEIARQYWIENSSTGNIDCKTQNVLENTPFLEDSTELRVIDTQHFFSMTPLL